MIFDLAKLKIPLIFLLICAILTAGMSAATDLSTRAEGQIYLPVLMYHHLSKTPSKLGRYTISPEQLQGDLEYIRKNGYTTVSVKQLIDYCERAVPLPIKPIMLTFDDGYASVYEYARPLLVKYNMCAVINIIGRQTELYSQSEDHNIRYAHLTWKQLQQMSAEGSAEVQNHTYDLHTNSGGRTGIQKLARESDEQYKALLTKDLMQLQSAAQQQLGRAPSAFAYPFGKISPEALPILKQLGFKAVFCCWERVNRLSGESEQLYHLNRFNRPHGTGSEEFFAKIEQQMQ